MLGGKSEGIEALKQGTDLNIAFERKSVVLIECIWVFSMSCTQGQALQDLISWQGLGTSASDCWNPEGYPERLAIFPGNYDRNSVKRGLKTVELRATTPSVGRNSVRINYDGEKLTQITGIQCDTRNSVSGVLARFRGIDFNGYRHCIEGTSIEGLRSNQYGIQQGNTRPETLSTDVKVSDPTPPTESTKIQNFFGSFGKEIEEHAIQQGSVRVNNGMQQDVGELAAHSSPLERKGNQGHRSQGRDVFKQQPTIIRPEDHRASIQHFKQHRHSVKVKHYYKPSEALPTARVIAMGQSLRHIPWNVEGNPESLATVTGNWAPNSLPKGPQTRGIRGNNDSVGGNRGQHMKNASRI
ncbi:hypothetical protein R3P38DRAFT_2808805 [Favolaschia claudopus]|uniref:Uncharacterized protein n=1 Tax=Favolaschia claudopus TaxID=2862362 RepID=A0AAV9ZFL0_9AGAR